MRSLLHSRGYTGLMAFFLAMVSAWTGRAQTVGPVSTYYLTAGVSSTVYIVQNGQVTASFPTVTVSSGSNYEYPIAVYGSTFRTTNGVSGFGNGYEYTLNGTPTGASYSLPSPISAAYDSTTDGTHNYLVDYGAGTVYQTDTDYTNPVALFGGLGGDAFLGITYDTTNNSLWVSGWTTNQVSDYALNGTLLSTFSATALSSSISGFALDPASGTFWMESQSSGVFLEYSKTGVLLQTVTIPSLVGVNILGGEFSTVPEPAPLALLSLGVVVLAGWRRWRRA
jgi:hypothetical protein